METESLLLNGGGGSHLGEGVKGVRGVWRKFLLFTLGVFFAFCAFNGSQNIASSLDLLDAEGLKGSTALGILYFFFTFFCLLAPLLLQKFGAKNVVLMQLAFIGLYTLSFVWPRWYTLYVSAALVGIGAGPFWAAQGLFCTTFAEEYDALTAGKKAGDGADAELDKAPSSVGLFQGYFFGIFQMTQVLGNLESSLFESLLSVKVLFLFYFGMIVFGAILVWFVPKLTKTEPPASAHEVVRGDTKLPPPVDEKSVVWTTLRVLQDPKMLALLPVFFACGLEQAVLFGDVTSLVKRRFGSEDIGYVMMCFGIGDALAAAVVGKASDKYGKIPFFLAAIVIHGGCCVYFFVLGQDEHQQWVPILILAFMWGVGDAIWMSITTATCGQLYESDIDRGGAFSNNKLMQSIAVTAAFFVPPSEKTFVPKLVCLMVSMVLAGVGILSSKSLRNMDSPDEAQRLRGHEEGMAAIPSGHT